MKTRHFSSVTLGACLVAGLCALVSPSVGRAQGGIGDIVYTVGTVTRDSFGRDWAYLLWQGTGPGLISNRVFAVYAKPGDATNNAPYARLSIIALQTDARVIEPLLERAQNLGDDLAKLQADLTQLFGNFMPSSAISRADQLSAVVRGSLNDPRYYENLLLLARNHPGINLALGYADAELIGPGLTTFEVRAFDPVANTDLAVIGRVTVQAGSPTVLPPPGPPILVPEPTAMGDLNLKFRWGTPDELRRLGLMQFGFNLYRVTQSFANSHGWNVLNPPSISFLTNLVATNPAAAKRINRVPITPGKQFTVPEAALLIAPGDTNTFFIMDDDGRGKTNYVNYGFTNGARFYYYAAARDVLAHDGALSPGLLATVCDRLPPYPPTHVHVLNDYQYNPTTLTSNQALKIVWRQNQQTNDSVVNYYVYRWTNLVQMNALQGNPANNLIAIIPHNSAISNNFYLDNGGGSPSALGAYGETFWYTVRAADAGACGGGNLSGAGGPAYGVLRDRIGPPAGSGEIEINCLRPIVDFGRITFPTLKDPDPTNFNIFAHCARLDPRFEWAEFYGLGVYQADLPGGQGLITVSNYLGRIDFNGSPVASTWWYPPRNPFTNSQPFAITLWVYCRAALLNGKVSNFAVGMISQPPTTQQYADLEFQSLAQSIRVVAGDRKNSDCIEHDPGGGGGGVVGTNNVGIIIHPTPGSAEYRLYRRVDAGPLSLLCQGPITNLLQLIKCFETAPPVNGGTICFYLQLFDENGNPSPLTPIGCIDTAPHTPLPTPVLAKITPTGDQNSPGMKLSWFCPPYGVDRFELRIAGLPTPPNTNQYALSQQLSSTGAPPVSMTFTNSGTNLTLKFNSFRSPKAGPAFGNNGAVFQVPCTVELGKTYYVTVRALSKNGDGGDFSNFENFVWVPTNTPSPQVPWPARPLPPSAANFFALAFFLSPTNANPALRPGNFMGNGVLVGFAGLSSRTVIVLKDQFRIGMQLDPSSILETNGFGGSVFPCAMYRYQVPNANFPVTSGDTIQVSPLMENIAYQVTSTPGQSTNTFIHDPFITGTAASDNTANTLYLWLQDTQPIISGARYKYVLVHFGSNHEIDQLIPSNEVEVP